MPISDLEKMGYGNRHTATATQHGYGKVPGLIVDLEYFLSVSVTVQVVVTCVAPPLRDKKASVEIFF